MTKSNGPETISTLGPYLRALRRTKKLTLRQAEEASGVSNAYISQLETGKIRTPAQTILRKLALAYDASHDALMGQAGYTHPTPFDDLTASEEAYLLVCLAAFRSRHATRPQREDDTSVKEESTSSPEPEIHE